MSDLVLAAGGVVWRRGPDGRPEVLTVHRPKYDDWSLPKGKLDAGEAHEAAALREVEEETGLRCRLGRPLGALVYEDRKGRPKEVRYWAMTVEDGSFSPNKEVDELRWVPADRARELLSYEHDADLVALLPPAPEAA
jgi:8-oxo-dGTP diphosphatase